MQTDPSSEHLERVEEAATGPIVDYGPDHLTIRDIGRGEELTFRTDDKTRYVWHDPKSQGRLTDTAQIRVGYFRAGGIHKAYEVIVLDPGSGESIAEQLVPRVH